MSTPQHAGSDATGKGRAKNRKKHHNKNQAQPSDEVTDDGAKCDLQVVTDATSADPEMSASQEQNDEVKAEEPTEQVNQQDVGSDQHEPMENDLDPENTGSQDRDAPHVTSLEPSQPTEAPETSEGAVQAAPPHHQFAWLAVNQSADEQSEANVTTLLEEDSPSTAADDASEPAPTGLAAQASPPRATASETQHQAFTTPVNAHPQSQSTSTALSPSRRTPSKAVLLAALAAVTASPGSIAFNAAKHAQSSKAPSFRLMSGHSLPGPTSPSHGRNLSRTTPARPSAEEAPNTPRSQSKPHTVRAPSFAHMSGRDTEKWQLKVLEAKRAAEAERVARLESQAREALELAMRIEEERERERKLIQEREQREKVRGTITTASPRANVTRSPSLRSPSGTQQAQARTSAAAPLTPFSAAFHQAREEELALQQQQQHQTHGDQAQSQAQTRSTTETAVDATETQRNTGPLPRPRLRSAPASTASQPGSVESGSSALPMSSAARRHVRTPTPTASSLSVARQLLSSFNANSTAKSAPRARPASKSSSRAIPSAVSEADEVTDDVAPLPHPQRRQIKSSSSTASLESTSSRRSSASVTGVGVGAGASASTHAVSFGRSGPTSTGRDSAFAPRNPDIPGPATYFSWDMDSATTKRRASNTGLAFDKTTGRTRRGSIFENLDEAASIPGPAHYDTEAAIEASSKRRGSFAAAAEPARSARRASLTGSNKSSTSSLPSAVLNDPVAAAAAASALHDANLLVNTSQDHLPHYMRDTTSTVRRKSLVLGTLSEEATKIAINAVAAAATTSGANGRRASIGSQGEVTHQ